MRIVAGNGLATNLLHGSDVEGITWPEGVVLHHIKHCLRVVRRNVN